MNLLGRNLFWRVLIGRLVTSRTRSHVFSQVLAQTFEQKVQPVDATFYFWELSACSVMSQSLSLAGSFTSCASFAEDLGPIRAMIILGF